MDQISYQLSIIAYYLSEYDIKAVTELGYNNRKSMIEDISRLLGRENNYLKLRRDEFDVLSNSHRKGWRNRPPSSDVTKIYNDLSKLDFFTLTGMVKKIITDAKNKQAEILNDQLLDREYVDAVNNELSLISPKKKYTSVPQSKLTGNIKKYVVAHRSVSIAANALCNANYRCEIDENHGTFIRKTNELPYTEPHHLIPLKFQNAFENSLDVENNIVSLCSSCHNHLHYGKYTEELLKKLYEMRKDLLNVAGLNISFEQLLCYYDK